MQKLDIASIKISHWPSLWSERWLGAQEPASSPFEEGGAAARLSHAIKLEAERHVGVYLCWLGEIDPSKPLETYVDRAAIKEFIEVYSRGRAEGTVACAIRGIAYYLRATVPPDGLPWLTKLAHRMSNTAQPSRPKLPRMVPISCLIELGARLMHDGMTALSDGRTHGATMYRNGLMIAALAARPTLRLKNFHALRANDTFFDVKGAYEVRVPHTQTKKKIKIAFRYPDWLTRPLRIYMEQIRPRLLDGGLVDDEGWLWVGRNGMQLLLPGTVGAIISETTARHLGRNISPHLFRDCAATDIALLAPADVGITKDVLGHATLASSQAHYNQAKSYTALAGLETALFDLVEDEQGFAINCTNGNEEGVSASGVAD